MSHRKKIAGLLAGILLCAGSVKAQKDTEFWFAVPDVSIATPYNADRPIALRMTAYSTAATVNVYQAATNVLLQTVTLPANTTQSIDLTASIDLLETKPANAVLNYGLRIQATSPISAYYEVVSGQNAGYQNNPEAYVLKGKNALGTEFWIPGQNLMNNNSIYSPLPYNSFDIIATEDNTQLQITPSHNITGHAAGVPFPLTLQRGQVYSAQATSQAAAQHLDGSRVSSNKPVAITVKDDLLSGAPYGTCSDMAGDQIVPIERIGTRYIATQGYLNSPNSKLFILATQNGTTVNKDGTAAGSINAGQTLTVDVANAVSTYIEASAPVYVWQLSGIGCELGGTILPTIDCSGSDTVSYVRSTNLQLYINLAVPAGGQNSFTINGTAISGAGFSFVPGTGNQWMAASINLPLAQYPQNSVVKVANSVSKFHMGALDGGNNTGTTYGYFSNYGGISVNATALPNPVCVGSNIQLQATSQPGTTYTWIGPGGFGSTLQNPSISSAGYLNAGTYTVTASNAGCTASGSVNVSVIKCPKECLIEVGYCVNLNNPYTYNFYANTSPSIGTFVWNFGDGSGNYVTGNGNIAHTFPGAGSYNVSVVFTTPSGQVCSKAFPLCVSRDVIPKPGNDQGLGVQESDAAENIGELYPNPANTLINIPVKAHNADARYSIVLFNVEGKTVQKLDNLQVKDGIIPVHIKNLQPGMYLCEIHTDGRKVSRKFVKL